MSIQINDDGRGGLASASGIERRVNCPGSREAEAICGPMPETEIADQGSRIHKAWELGDLSELDDEEIQILAGINKIEAEAVAKWRADLEIPDGDEVKCVKEERLWVRQRGTLKPLASAKLDRYWVWKTFALTIDAKSGFLPTTPSPKNWQLRTAALALKSEIPDLTSIRVAIAQHRFRSRYDACDYSVEDLEGAELDLLHALWRAEQPEAERFPGAWCKYCTAKANCPQFAAVSLLPMVKTGVDYNPNLRGKDLKTEIAGRVSLLGPEDLAFIYSKRHVMAGIQEAVLARLRMMGLQELQAINLTLEPGYSTRDINNIDGAFNILIKAGLMSVDEFHDCCKLAIGRIEVLTLKRIVEKDLAKNQDLAKKYLGTLLSPVITLTQRQSSIVTLETAPAMPAAENTQTNLPEEAKRNPNGEQPVQTQKSSKVKRARKPKA